MILLLCCLELLSFAIGVGMYASVDMERGPYEAVCFALHKKRMANQTYPNQRGH